MRAKKVRELISNELWQATGTNNVRLSDFENLDEIFKKLSDWDDKSEFKTLCEAELTDTRKPIVPRYFATLCGKHPIDDNFAFTVFDEYYRDNKWNEVIYLGNKLLTFSESPYVLKAMADCYKINNRETERIEILERLIKADHLETDAFYAIAEYYEKDGDQQTALNYYKRVVQRHITGGDLISIKDIWPKLIELKGENPIFLIQISEKIAKVLGKDKGIYFLYELFNNGNLDLNVKIKVLKKILEISSENKEAMDLITNLFKEKYKDNPRLEYCLNDTGMSANYLNASTAIQKFETEIEFTEGAFVYHNTWKLGRIRTIEQDEMSIQFLSKKDLHKMSCNMAFSSLKVLPKQHIMVLKAGVPAEKIREKILDKTEWSLKMLLNSFNGQASFKQIKAELVPSILKESDWTVWLNAAKKELSSNPYFSTSEESNEIFVLRETPISFEEKSLQIFSREKGFFNKYAILKDFVKSGGSTESEEFSSMLKYFDNESKNNSAPSICSLIVLIDNMGKNYEEILKQKIISLSTVELTQIYKDIADSDLKKQFVSYVNSYSENSTEVMIEFLHANPNSQIIDYIKSGSRKFNSIIKSSIENFNFDPDLTIYLYKSCSNSDWKKTEISEEDLLTSKLQLLISVNGKVSHKVDIQINKTRQKALYEMLWGNQEIVNFLKTCETNQAKRIYSFVSNIPEIDDDKLLGIKHFILSNRTDAQAIVGNIEPVADEGRRIPKGFLCTRIMFNAKKDELEHIMNVEIPENSKEIGTARDLGDLRENAEYQYAKDKQKNLNFMMNKLTDEIDIAKIIDPEEVNTDFVEFGVDVVFMDNINKKEIKYTVLGPWESNPDKNILNFQAPLGLKIYNMQLNENKKFEINGVKYDYTVKSIGLADYTL